MLRIREMREDKAGKALVAARHAQQTAATELASRQSRLERYRATKEERRDKVYDAIMGRPVSREDIDLAREAVSRIDEEGILLQDGVVRAQTDLKAKEEESEKARGRYVAATKNHQKIIQHRAIWQEEENKRLEYAAEAELEEFTGRKMIDDDSDDFD